MMKNNLQKLLALLLTAAVVFSFAACGGKTEDETTTTAPAGQVDNTTEAPTGAEGESTTANGTTNDAIPTDTTVPGETTTAGGNTNTATTAAPVNKKPETKAEILEAYTKVMNNAKTVKPGFTKIEYQALPDKERKIGGQTGWLMTRIINLLLDIVGGYMTTEDDARKDPGVYDKNNDMKAFPVKDAPKGCMMTDPNFLKSADCQVLSNGNYKITIVLKDEMNPEHYKSGNTAPSKHGGVFTPLSKSDIDPELAGIGAIKEPKYSLKYYNSKAVLVYNPKNNQIVSLDQTTYTLADMSGKVLGSAVEGSVVLEMYYKFYSFKY